MNIVLSRQEILSFRHSHPYYLISFHDYDMKPAQLHEDKNRVKTLILRSDDLREVGEHGFQEKDGKFVAEAFTYIQENHLDIVTHCNAGISRSRGVGVAYDILQDKDPREHFIHGNPNPIVVHHILTAMRKTHEHNDWPKNLRRVIACRNHPHEILTPGKNIHGFLGICNICHEERRLDNGEMTSVLNGSFKHLL